MNQGTKTFFENSFFKSKGLVLLLGSYWVLTIFLEHRFHIPEYVTAIQQFAYWDFLILYALLSLGVVLVFSKGKLMFPLTLFNIKGLYGPLYLYLSVLLFVSFYISKNPMEASVLGFALKSGKVYLSIGVLLFASWSLGHRMVTRFKPREETPLLQWIQIGIGTLALAFVLFFLAALQLFNLYATSALLVLSLGLGGASFWKKCKRYLWDSHKVSGVTTGAIGVYLFIQILIVANVMAVSSPVPLGFDSLTLYLNLPKIIAEQGGLIEGYHPHYWSLIIGLGFAIFDNTLLVLHLGMLPGILSLFLIYGISRLYLSSSSALLTAGLYYSLPMILWQSSFEIKTDLGMLFFALCAIALVFSTYTNKGVQAIFEEKWKTWLMAGLFCGFALGIKLTTFTLIAALAVGLVYWHLGLSLGMAFLSLILAGAFGVNLSDFANLDLTSLERYSLLGALGGAGLVVFLLHWKSLKESGKEVMVYGSLLGGGVLLLMLPWMVKNGLEGRNWVTGQNLDNQEIKMGIRPSFMSDTEVTVKEVLKPSGRKEEINRYLGYEGGVLRFLSLPYDLTLQRNVALFASEIGPFFLALLPLLLLIKGGGIFNLLRFLLLMIVLALSWVSAQDIGGEMSWAERWMVTESSGGLHRILLSPLLLLSAALNPLYRLLTQFSDWGSIVQWLFVGFLFFVSLRSYVSKTLGARKDLFLFLAVYFFLWTLLSSGIPWYGMVGFALLPLLLVGSLETIGWNPWLRGVVFLWFALIVPFKFSPLAARKAENPELLNFKQLVPEVNLLYASGALTHRQSMERVHNLPTRQMIDLLNAQPEAGVLNLGTMLRYYIQNSEQRLFDDNQLDLFYSLWINSGKSKIATANRLQQLGVDYILLDLDVHTMDVTVEGSLRAKVEEFVDFIYRNEKVELLFTDRLVEHPSGEQNMNWEGRNISVKHGLFGLSIVDKGKYALLRIKN